MMKRRKETGQHRKRGERYAEKDISRVGEDKKRARGDKTFPRAQRRNKAHKWKTGQGKELNSPKNDS